MWFFSKRVGTIFPLSIFVAIEIELSTSTAFKKKKKKKSEIRSVGRVIISREICLIKFVFYTDTYKREKRQRSAQIAVPKNVKFGQYISFMT